jgi:hypothetical protein
MLGLAGGALAVLAATGALFGVYERQSAPQFLLTFPEMIWEATFGIYLVVRGFTRPAQQHEAGTRDAAPAIPAVG